MKTERDFQPFDWTLYGMLLRKKRLAAVLDWGGDPSALFEEVVADDLANKLS